MKNDLFEILKELKNIQPDSEYAKRSRYLILSAKTRTTAGILEWFSIHRLATATALIGALVLIVVLSVSYLPGGKNGLVVEADEINSSIQIRLNEINYQLQNNPAEINLSEIGKIQTNLEQIAGLLTEAQALTADQDNIEEALEKIKTAESLLSETESLLIKN